MLIQMQYPEDKTGKNKFLDGKIHKIIPISLKKFDCYNDDLYLCYYYDLDKIKPCVTVLRKENGEFYKVPLDSYDKIKELEKYIIDSEELTVLKSEIKLDNPMKMDDLLGFIKNETIKIAVEQIAKFEVMVLEGNRRKIRLEIAKKYLAHKYNLVSDEDNWVEVTQADVNYIEAVSHEPKLQADYFYPKKVEQIAKFEVMVLEGNRRKTRPGIAKKYLAHKYNLVSDEDNWVEVTQADVNYIEAVSHEPKLQADYQRVNLKIAISEDPPEPPAPPEPLKINLQKGYSSHKPILIGIISLNKEGFVLNLYEYSNSKSLKLQFKGEQEGNYKIYENIKIYKSFNYDFKFTLNNCIKILRELRHIYYINDILLNVRFQAIYSDQRDWVKISTNVITDKYVSLMGSDYILHENSFDSNFNGFAFNSLWGLNRIYEDGYSPKENYSFKRM